MEDRYQIKRIVVGIDGSDHSRAALQWAIQMARGMSAEVVAVYAVETPVYFNQGYGAMIPPALDPEWRAQMKHELEDVWCKPLRDAGVQYSVIMEDGRPASVIAQVADRVDADVVVVGRRGRAGVTELLLGSVSHALSQQCKRPVLLISRPIAAKPSDASRTTAARA